MPVVALVDLPKREIADRLVAIIKKQSDLIEKLEAGEMGDVLKDALKSVAEVNRLISDADEALIEAGAAREGTLADRIRDLAAQRDMVLEEM